MTKIARFTPAYNPSSKTIDFAGFQAATGETFALRSLLAVINITTGSLLYAQGNPALTATYSGSVLTLNNGLVTTGQQVNDTLAIFYDALDTLVVGAATEAKQDNLISAVANVLAKLSGDPSTASLQTQQKSTLDSILSKLSADPSTGALQSTGNTTLAAISAATGARADAQASDDTGAWSVISLLKRLLGKLPGLGQRAASSSVSVTLATDQSAIPVSGTVAVTGVATSAKQDTLLSALGTPFQAGGSIGNTSFGATQSGAWTVNLGALNGAATETTLGQIKGLLQQQASIATSLFTDNSGAYFVRRDMLDADAGTVTVTFTDATGSAAAPGAGLRPVVGERQVSEVMFEVITSGTGYSIGDLLLALTITDTSVSPATSTQIWRNVTTAATLSSAPTQAHLEFADKRVFIEGGNTNAVKIDGSSVTQPISVAALPLPSGAATSEKQDAGNTALTSILSTLGGTLAVSGPLTDAQLRASDVPVSGSVTANAGTDLNTSALALESGGNLAGIRSDLGTDGTASPTIAGTGVRGWLRGIYEKLAGTLTIGGTVNVQGGNSTAVIVDGSAVTQPISVVTLPLPSGAATEAKQDNGNTSLSNIDGKLPALVSSRVPVDGSGVTQPVSGAVTANAGTNLNTSALALEVGGNLEGIRTDLGTDGATPPAITGTGVRGWLRALYDQLMAGVFTIITNPGKYAYTDPNPLSLSTPNAAAVLTGGPYASLSCDITFANGASGTVAIEALNEAGTTWSIVAGTTETPFTQAPVFSPVNAVSATGRFGIWMPQRYSQLRVRVVTPGAGTATIRWRASSAPSTVAAVLVSGTQTIGSAQIIGGGNVASVKTASTAAVAADPALVTTPSPNGRQRIFVTTSSVTALSVATSTSGSPFTAFASQACEALDIVNDTGTSLEYQRGGTGTAMRIPSGSSRLITGITNANQIGLRRVDQSTVSVTVYAEALTP